MYMYTCTVTYSLGFIEYTMYMSEFPFFDISTIKLNISIFIAILVFLNIYIYNNGDNDKSNDS